MGFGWVGVVRQEDAWGLGKRALSVGVYTLGQRGEEAGLEVLRYMGTAWCGVIYRAELLKGYLQVWLFLA